MKRVKASSKVQASMSPSATRAAKAVHAALRSLYDVMSRYEDNIEQLLDDPSYYEATMDQIRYLESFLNPVEGASQPGANFRSNVSRARDTVKMYSSEQQKFVRDCLDEVIRIANEGYDNQDIEDNISRSMNECIQDYKAVALEDGILTSEEFDELYEAMDVLDTDEANAYA